MIPKNDKPSVPAGLIQEINLNKAILEQIKTTAQAELPALAQEAGFRLTANGRRFHCFDCEDKNPSVWLYPERLHAFCCDRSFDGIDLEQLARGGTAGEAIGRLASRYGIATPTRGGGTHRITAEALARAELFRIGFRWAIERYLDALKELWAIDENAVATPSIRDATRLLDVVTRWSPWQTARFLENFQRRKFAARCIDEAHETQTELAHAITGAFALKDWAAA